ncbi:MAG: efflux RND transporter permease subunit [Planctomycetes bacterium]|nr:efflux RND transporter permease subunit [Planctomycetota bacterium]
MSIPEFSVKNRILVNLVFLLCGMIGLLAYNATVIDVYPDVSFDLGSILVAWPGASPEEIESGITRKIEEEILETKGVSRIVSNSERNRTLIDVKFLEKLSNEEFDSAFADLRARVERVNDLPEGAEKPIVTKISVSELYPLLQVVVVSDGRHPQSVTREVAKNLRERLRRVDGIQRVSNIGIPELEWRVRVRRQALDSTGLTLLEVSEAVRARHKNVPAGTTRGGEEELAVAATGEVRTREQLLDIIVGHRPGAPPVRLREIADVSAGLERLKHINRYNGRPCINLSVAKEKGADSMSVREKIDVAISDFLTTEGVPEGLQVETAIDTTKILDRRISVLVDNLLFGIVLVFLVLWLLIGARNSLLAIIGIPFSFLVAFAVLNQFGMTINAISLFSLMLVSGMVVDDAIVVLENIYRRVERGNPPREAIIEGTREVFWPVVTSSVTTCAAFLPMLLMEGVTGEFMSIIPKTVITVLVASLLECLIILPAHYVHFGSRKPQKGPRVAVTRALRALERTYVRSLGPVIKRPLMVFAIVIAITGLAGWLATDLPVELFPSDFQAFFCNVYADPEYGLQATSEALREVEALVQELMPDQVESFTTSVGVAFTDDNQILLKPSVGQLLVYVAEKPDVDASAVISEVRRRIQPLLDGKGQHQFRRIFVDEFNDGPPTGKPVAVRVAGPNYDENKAIARQIQDFLKSLDGVHTVADNLDEGPREVRVTPRPVALARAGVRFDRVARCVFVANEGWDLGDVLPEGRDEEARLRVQLREEDRRNPADLMLLKVRGPNGRAIPLAEVANQETVRGPASLYHYDGDRVVLVTADVDKSRTDSTTVNEAVMREFEGIEKAHPDVSLFFGGEFEETRKSFDSLKKAFLVAIVLIFTILAAQFRSYTAPIVIMSVVPFSFVGVILGLVLLGFPFTILAFIAIVGLSGVVVNDSLVLLDFIRRHHRESGDCAAAVREGCRLRMRAVLLTTVTTVFGLLPMALGLTGHSKIWTPFAATITFGLALAMFLTLYVVPAVYVAMYRNKQFTDTGATT